MSQGGPSGADGIIASLIRRLGSGHDSRWLIDLSGAEISGHHAPAHMGGQPYSDHEQRGVRAIQTAEEVRLMARR
jgi:hypothetical protein